MRITNWDRSCNDRGRTFKLYCSSVKHSNVTREGRWSTNNFMAVNDFPMMSPLTQNNNKRHNPFFWLSINRLRASLESFLWNISMFQSVSQAPMIVSMSQRNLILMQWRKHFEWWFPPTSPARWGCSCCRKLASSPFSSTEGERWLIPVHLTGDGVSITLSSKKTKLEGKAKGS